MRKRDSFEIVCVCEREKERVGHVSVYVCEELLWACDITACQQRSQSPEKDNRSSFPVGFSMEMKFSISVVHWVAHSLDRIDRPTRGRKKRKNGIF